MEDKSEGLSTPQPEKSSRVNPEPSSIPLRAHFNIIRESWRRLFPKIDTAERDEAINQAVDRNKISGDDAQKAKENILRKP